MIFLKNILHSIKKFREGPEKILPMTISKIESLEPLSHPPIDELTLHATGKKLLPTFKYSGVLFFVIFAWTVLLMLLLAFATYAISYESHRNNQISKCGVTDEFEKEQAQYRRKLDELTEYRNLMTDTFENLEDNASNDKILTAVHKTSEFPLEADFYDYFKTFDMMHSVTPSDLSMDNPGNGEDK